MESPSVSIQIARALLDIRAVTFSPNAPFTWASGLRAPVYCDNRISISHPTVRRTIRDAFHEKMDEAGWDARVVAGTATAGIPHAAWLAEKLDVPMVYVRSRPKSHGKGSQVEGRLQPGDRVVVVEDLVSTGGSSAEVVKALREAGADVQGVLAIFSYGLAAADTTFEKLSIPLYTLTTFEALFDVARERDLLSDADIASIRDWREDPAAWSTRERERA